MDEKSTFVIINDDGEEVESEILFTFENKETKKNYIVYTDNSVDENGETLVFANVYNPDKDDEVLLPIETEEEWDMIEKIFEELQNG